MSVPISGRSRRREPIRLERAVASFVFMALDPSLAGRGGGFYADRQPFPSSPESHDEAKARRFWALAEAATRSGPWP
jgi:hypothetical protein